MIQGRSVSLTIKGCGGEIVSIRCEGGLIAALGPGVEAVEGDEVIEAEGMLPCAPFAPGD